MEQSTNLVRSLEQIGLKEKEAVVYLALLRLGGSTAYQIAQHCDVKKPTVYVVLEDLRQKGLVLKVPHAKKSLYTAKDMAEYLAEQRGKLGAVQSMLPRLQSLSATSKPSVYFFTGLRGIQQAMDHKFDSMRDRTFHSFYGNANEASPDVVKLYDSWDRRAVDAGIRFEIVMPKVDGKQYEMILGLFYKKVEGVHIKFLEQYVYPSHLSIEIGSDFVRIDDAKNLTATVIDDPATAEAMRQIFQIVWEKGV